MAMKGGTGIVGSGIVSNLVQQGAKCWIPTRDEGRFAKLLQTILASLRSQVELFKGDVSLEKDAGQLKQAIHTKDGQLNHVVSSIGGGFRQDGKLSTLSVDTFNAVMYHYTVPHFVVYKTFAPDLAKTPQSTYTFVTGGSTEARMFDPKASMLPVTTGAHYGLFTSANSEFPRNKNMTIMELRVFTWVRRDADSTFAAKKKELELGTDFVGSFVPKIIAKRKTDIYKVQNRTSAVKLFDSL